MHTDGMERGLTSTLGDFRQGPCLTSLSLSFPIYEMGSVAKTIANDPLSSILGFNDLETSECFRFSS